MSEAHAELTDYFLRLNPHLEPDIAATAVRRAAKAPAASLAYLAACVEETKLSATAPDNVQTLVRAMHQIGATAPRQPTCPRCFAERRVAHILKDGTRACRTCSARENFRNCSRCGSYRHVHRIIDGADLCRPCIEPRQIRNCIRCGEPGTVFRNVHGRKVCLRCAPPDPHRCHHCGQVSRIAATLAGGPTCYRCYQNIRRNSRPCPSCGRQRILAYPAASGTAICAECANVPARYACRKCGGETYFLGPQCARCDNSELLDAALGIPARDPALQQLRHELEKLGPLALNKWLTRSPSRQDFLAVVTTAPPRSVTLLADAKPGYATTHLRHLLLSTGVIAGGTDLWMDLYDDAVSKVLSGLDPEHRRIVREYSAWTVRPKLIRSTKRRPLGEPQLHTARTQIAGAIRFLQWLEARKVDPRYLDQATVDDFTSTNAHDGWLRNFLRWLGRTHGLTFELTSRTKQLHFPKISDDRRIDIAIAILNDTQIPQDIRIAALLVTTLGLNITTTVSLRRDNLRFLGPEAAWITVRGIESELPGWLARQLWHQISDTTGEWVFPGRMPGTHLSPAARHRHLARFGVTLRDLQVAARFQLSAAMNPVMLANTIGLTSATMLAYRHLSGGGWADATHSFTQRARAESRKQADRSR